MTEDKIDRFGLCPNCQTSWKGKDVLEALSKLDCNKGKSDRELTKLAASYGWTEDNKICFSNTISHEIDGKTLLECPKITCGHVFDRYTGEEYRSMFDAKRGILVHYNADRTQSATISTIDMSDISRPGLSNEGLQVLHENH